MALAITPNNREIISAKSDVTQTSEYLSSHNSYLNVNADITANTIGLATSDNQTNGNQITKVQETTPTDPSQNNPSYIIYKNAAGYTVKIEETIGATTYTTNIVPYDSDTVSTQQKSISPWT